MEFIVDMIGVALKDIWSQAGLTGVVVLVVIGVGYAWIMSGDKK